MPEIYQPAEDSFLLVEFLKKEIEKSKPKTILDMGSGSGIQAETAINQGINSENLTLVDINKDAVKSLSKKFPNSKVILSNLFDNINGRFDLIVFNSPYLPFNKFDKGKDTTGGYGLIEKFLRQAKVHLSKKGEILLLTSSFTGKINFKGYNKKILGKKRIFFEELYVWKLYPED